jgi:prepilin-type processing-associated H-X9-DG protein
VPRTHRKTSRSFTPWRGLCLAGLLAALLLKAGCQGATVPAGEGDSKPPAKAAPAIPTDLDLVPQDAAAFIHIRLADLWKADELKELRTLLALAGPQALQSLDGQFVPAPSTIEPVTWVFLTPESLQTSLFSGSPEGVSPLLVVSTSTPFDRDKVRKALPADARVKKFQDHEYLFLENTWSGLLLIDDHTFAMGSEDAVIEWFQQSARGKDKGAMQVPLGEAAGKNQVVIGVNPSRFATDPLVKLLLPPDLRPLLQSRSATLALNLDRDLAVRLRLDFAGEAEAGAGVKALNAGRDLARQAIARASRLVADRLRDGAEGRHAEPGKEKADRTPKALPVGLPELPEKFALLTGLGLLRKADDALQALVLEQKGPIVRLPVKVPSLATSNLFLGSMLSLAAITTLGTNANKTFTTVGTTIGGVRSSDDSQLKKLAQALDKYHAAHGHFPPAARFDKDGRALLSWRVELLPFLGEEALYRRFKLDEPWDSLHNKKLLKDMPAVFTSLYNWDPGKTRFQGFAGKGTLFDGKEGVRKSDVTDGLADTILLVQVSSSRAVYWTKPADLSYAADQPLPAVSGPFEGGFNALFADGSVRFIRQETRPETLRAWITRNGGEKIKENFPR